MRHLREIDLGGQWRFRPDPANLGEHFPEQLDMLWHFDARWMDTAHDDSAWASIRVPACWQAEGHSYNGVAWYRKTFDMPPAEFKRQRTWLRFEGVDYFADVWLNDHYLGSHEGYFSAFQHEITRYLRPISNVLAVRVDSPNDVSAKENPTGQLKDLIKGALQRWDMNDPEMNPGGIWNEVKLIVTGPAAITHLSLAASIARLPEMRNLAEPVPATALIGVGVTSTQASTARLHVHIKPVNHGGPEAQAILSLNLLPGYSVWTVPIEFEQAHLWFTWDLGEPCLYEAIVWLEADSEVSDEVRQTFGFRHLERRQGWEMYLNGVRFFQRGANYLSDQLLSTMTAERYAQDVQLLREANLNTVHPFAVVEKQAFYDLCDRHGLLVYQDFPMWLAMKDTGDLVRRATAQVEELIAQFGHHPSLGIWNFGSQPSEANFRKLGSALAVAARELDSSRIVHQANALLEPWDIQYDPIDDYHWDGQTAQEFQAKFDWRMDSHQYRGWYFGPLEKLSEVPLEHLELVTEYGAQALPSKAVLEQMIPPQALFPPVWSYYARRCFQPEYQFLFIPQPASLDQFIKDSQAYQARVIQYHSEYYRRHKFAPCNGAHLFCFNDCWPAITWSVVDYDRNRKPGFEALRRAMSPLQALAEFRDDEAVIWLVNDYPHAFPALTLRWAIRDEASQVLMAEGEMRCEAGPNTLERIGSLPGPVESNIANLYLEVREGEVVVAENFYRIGQAGTRISTS